ncbi:MAG: lipopolysaccharide biosynthesis protein [Microgenomates group bacterium]
MISTIKKGIVAVAEILHLKLFQHEMSDQMRKFLRHLSWSVAGGITASAIMMIINIYAGRLMGPEEFGKYSLITTIAQILIVPMLFGLDVSSLISISKNNDITDRKKIISSSIFFVFLSSILLTIIFIFSLNYLNLRFSLGKSFFVIAFIYSLLVGYKAFLDSIIRGLHLFRYQFFGKITEILILGIIFYFTFVLGNRHDYYFFVISLIFGFLVLLAIYFKKIIPYITHFDFSSLLKQLSLGRIIFIGTVLAVGFNSIDKLIIVKYLTFTDLGIYSAYYMVSVNLMAQLTQMFINVFLPSISGINYRVVVKKIDRLFLICSLPLIILMIGVILVAISLFGAKYSINLNLVLSFSILSALYVYLSINGNILVSISKEIYRHFVLLQTLINIFHILAYGLLIFFHAISVQALVILYILNAMIVIIIQKYLIKSYINMSIDYLVKHDK